MNYRITLFLSIIASLALLVTSMDIAKSKSPKPVFTRPSFIKPLLTKIQLSIATRDPQKFVTDSPIIKTRPADKFVPKEKICLAAYEELKKHLTEGICAEYLAKIFAFDAISNAERFNQTKLYCTSASKCQQVLKSKLKSFQGKCKSDEELGAALVKRAVFYLESACVTKDIKGDLNDTAPEQDFCAAELVIASTDKVNFTSIDQSYLDVKCSKCVVNSIDNLGVISNVDGANVKAQSARLRALCTKSNGKFCSLNFKKVLAKIRETKNETIVKEILSEVCGSCLRVFIKRLKDVNDTDITKEEAALFAKYAKYCRKYKGDFCLARVFKAADFFSEENPCKDIENSCNDKCAAFVKAVVNQGKCCWPIIYERLNINNEEARKRIKIAVEKCGVSLPKCNALNARRIVVTFTNIKKEWFNKKENKEKVDAAVLKDVENTYGDLIVEKVETMIEGNKVIAKITVQKDEGDNEELFKEGYKCDEMCNLDTASREDIAERTSVTTQIEEIVREDPSSSASVAALSSLLAIFALFAILF